MTTTERLAFTVRELAAMIGVHDDTLRSAIKRGDVRAVRLGRQWLIPATEVERILSAA